MFRFKKDIITKSRYPVTIFKNPRTAAPYAIFYQPAEKTTFMEVQAEPDMIGNYIEMYHLAPAKHMDQKHWLAVPLDGSVSDSKVLDLLDMSYDLVDEQAEADSQTEADRQQTVQQKKKDWWATDVKVEFDKLKAENPDVIGWIRFDNQDELGINYPILYSGDNQKYLRTDLHGNSHIAGCIFLEGLNKSDFSDYYNIIYGHNMNDGSMFGSLKKYKDDGFWKENQYFTVYSETTAYRYRIFSYEDAVNDGDVYKVGYQPGEEYQKFIDQMIKDSDVDTGVKPQTSNKILTLSTCTGNGYSKRLAIHAVCVDAQTTDESKLKETGN